MSAATKPLLVILRREYLELTEDFCAAKLIEYFKHWTNWKLKNHRTPWIYQPLKKIYEGLMGEHSLHVIRRAIALLESMGIIKKQNNPGNGQDKTYQYKLELDILDSLIEHRECKTETPECENERSEFNVESHHRINPNTSDPLSSDPKSENEDRVMNWDEIKKNTDLWEQEQTDGNEYAETKQVDLLNDLNHGLDDSSETPTKPVEKLINSSTLSNNSKTNSQAEQPETMAIVTPRENNYQTQTDDPYFHRRRAKPNETQWDWLPDGPWKTELGKLDDAFVMAIASKWAKEYGGTAQDKKPNVLKHFRNEPTNIPIEWEWYQEGFFHRAANLLLRKSHGIDTNLEELELMKQARAATPLDDSLHVTASRTPVEVIEAYADYALPTIEQIADQEMIPPEGAEGAEAYTRTVKSEDAEFWRHRTNNPASKTYIAVSSAEQELAKSQIEALKQRKAKPPRHSQEENISESVDRDEFLEDRRKFLRFGSPKMKDEAIAWAKDPMNGCELITKDGVVVDIKEVDF